MDFWGAPDIDLDTSPARLRHTAVDAVERDLGAAPFVFTRDLRGFLVTMRVAGSRDCFGRRKICICPGRWRGRFI